MTPWSADSFAELSTVWNVGNKKVVQGRTSMVENWISKCGKSMN